MISLTRKLIYRKLTYRSGPYAVLLQHLPDTKEKQFHANRMKDAAREKKVQARVEIEKSIELLAPAVANREEVMRNVVDSARERIAARKKMSGQKVEARSAAAGGNGMDES